ncbi:MAG: potassium transporter [Maricaulis sp.]|jgi:monovalent cation:proton antiporter-2 (CPA2) family protein|nr:potassium transporter [Maricaulis sp.]HAQ34078.1 potassium transporter [Alphaproteobacteria bacterium]
MDSFLGQALIFLIAGVIAVPIANRLGLGSVLGYLLAGIALSPVLAAVGIDPENLLHFAEFGVVMMLFIIGLELSPKLLWDMRIRLLGLGGAQVIITAALIAAGAFALGLEWRASIAVGLILSLSSTAIVLKTLEEKSLMKTEGGRASFSILLFQDVAVIPILAILPLLMVPGGYPSPEETHAAETLISHLPGWMQAGVIVGVIAGVVLFGRFAVRPMLRVIANTRLREMFTAAALLIVIAISWLMTMVGLSPALGAFLAGVVLADSEFRHELEADIDPFKGLLLGLFFITVGAGVDFEMLMAEPAIIVGIAIGLIVLKIAVISVIALGFKLPATDRWLAALGLAQAGEFGFVLLTFATGNDVLSEALAGRLTLSITLSMLVTPLLFMAWQYLLRPKLAKREPEVERGPDQIDEQGVAIIAGLGRFGQIVQRMLTASGYTTVVLDHSAPQIELLNKFGVKAYYGDAARVELLHAAGIERAKVLVVTIANVDKAIAITKFAKQANPDVKVITRATDRVNNYRLCEAGADIVIRETFFSALEAAGHALESLGIPREQAERMKARFREHDEAGLSDLFEHWKDNPDVFRNQNYISRARSLSQTLGEVLSKDRLDHEAGDDPVRRD